MKPSVFLTDNHNFIQFGSIDLKKGTITTETRFANGKITKQTVTMTRERRKLEEAKIKQREKKEIDAKRRDTPTYRLLDNMINDLYNDGVDVSYFPDSAEQVLEDYSKKIKLI